MSGICPSARGSCQTPVPPFSSAWARSSASANTGFLVSGRPSLLPLANRLTHSTPAEMNTSPSPALMAFHAIKAGEGDVFISAGVECVSRFAKGSSDGLPDTKNPVFAEAEERAQALEKGGTGVWHDPRADGQIPDIYIAMGQTAENVAGLRGVTRQEQD